MCCMLMVSKKGMMWLAIDLKEIPLGNITFGYSYQCYRFDDYE